MEIETKVISNKLVVYSQERIKEIILDKKEAKDYARELILAASDLLNFSGDVEVSTIIYNAETLIK